MQETDLTWATKNENDVRRWLKKQMGKSILWVEHGAGGTAGMTDALIIMDRRLVPIELKYGRIDWDRGVWRVALRPSQFRVMRAMTNLDVDYFVLVGDEKGVGLCRFEKKDWCTRTGDPKIICPISDGGELQKAVRDAQGRDLG